MMQLYNLPFDELKIDQCFIGRSDSHPEARAITRTIVELGQRLNLAVVGEGIETAEQRDYLCDTRCNIGQGYLFARPMPVSDFNAWSRCPPSAVNAASATSPLSIEETGVPSQHRQRECRNTPLHKRHPCHHGWRLCSGGQDES